MTTLLGSKLAELISRRLACLIQLHKLGQKQSELIESGEIGSLLRLLSAKNQLIAALQTLESQLAPFHEQDPEARTWDTPAAREHCAEQARQCREYLNAIMQLERENEHKMAERRDHVASQLQNMQSGETARRAYQAHSRSLPGVPLRTAIGAVASMPDEPRQRLDLQTGT